MSEKMAIEDKAAAEEREKERKKLEEET